MKSALVMLIAPLVFVAMACADLTATIETRDDSFAVGESPTVVVTGDNGRIIVNPGTDGTVRVEATLRRPEDLEYETTREGQTISVVAREKDHGLFDFGVSSGADIEITAPSDTRVELQTSNGEVEVYGMHRSGAVRTSNGEITVEDVAGKFDISTTNGSVTIGLASGTFDVGTVNGRIKFDGELAPGGDNRMTTVNGSVQIKLHGTPSVELDAASVNGSVTSGFPILVTSSGDKGRLVGTIGAGEAELLVEAVNGSVTIH